LRNILKYKFLLLLALLAAACSTTKNTFMSRSFHNVTSHYNVYFNGNESFKKGVKRAESSQTYNYSKILPVFYYSDKAISQAVTGDMDRAIKKASKVITLHSITAKPKLKKGPQSPKQKEFYNKKEYNNWIDDAFMLLGKSYVYQNQFGLAAETFKHVITNYPDQPVRYNALIWLSRVYIETGEYREAEKILTSLQSDEKLPRKLKEDFYTSFADLHIKEKNYIKAAEMLEKAIELVNSKHYRTHYTYILAQVYQDAGELEKALNTYKKVIKMNPPYEMTFNAKVNMARSFQVGSLGGKEIRNLLYKMLKDEKNKDFQDQIYYALANISMKEGNKEEAVSLYKLSIGKSVSNVNQKGLAYLALADIYYAIPEYSLAQAYYDSTMQSIENTFENYDLISKKAKSLTHLVENLVVYELEDSVQVLAKLPEAELYAIIDKMIADVVTAEQEIQKKKSEEMLDQQYGMMNQNSGTNGQETGNTEGGSWYFYNLNAKSFGQPDFRMRWGTRKLEDNWRRKNKAVVENYETGEAQSKSDTASETKTTVLSNKTREYYLQNIPFSDSALESSNERLINALFKMGEVYRYELLDNKNAIASFEEIISKYPTHNLLFPSYYNLYEIYLLLNNTEKSEFYKNLIINQFPDNPRAKILADPEYVKELEKEMNRINNYYEETYLKYKAGDYISTVSNADYALIQYKGDEIIPRFMLLRALSLGQLQGKEKLKTELDTLVKTYPDHEVSIYAKEVIDYIYSMSPDIQAADITAQAEEIYSLDSTEVHYLVISAVKTVDINQLNFNLINYNLDNFDNLNLGILKTETKDNNLLVVQSFSDLEKAQRYFLSLNSRKTDITGNNKEEDVKIFLISASNYLKLLKDNTVSKYFLFYEKYY
jgi:tetratricopeptide (TPR) repeat protein